MTTLAIDPTSLVAKENISQYLFPKDDVLSNPEKRKERYKRAERAMKLGNTRKSKVRIFFEDNEGIKTVETTVWGVTEENLLLKKTTLIPLRRIHQIKFY